MPPAASTFAFSVSIHSWPEATAMPAMPTLTPLRLLIFARVIVYASATSAWSP